MEGFHGSDLDMVTLLPPTFCGLELSHVTTAAWEIRNEVQPCAQRAGKWPDESCQGLNKSNHTYISCLSILDLSQPGFKALYNY